MARDGAVLNKLAWRAKWRARFKAWKKTITIAIVVPVALLSVLVFTPWLPDYYEKGILKYQFEEGSDDHIRHEAVEQMYKLGCFYNYTMREDKGAECFLKITEWHYGFSIQKWCYEREKCEKERRTALRDIKRKKKRDGKVFKGPPFIFEKRTEPFIGYSLFRYGEYNDRIHKAMTKQIYEEYIATFSEAPGADPVFTNRAQLFIARYKGSL